MRLVDWDRHTVKHACRGVNSALAVTLPFLPVPGVFRDVFPRATINLMSAISMPDVHTPPLRAEGARCERLPNLTLHTGLVAAYWRNPTPWSPWGWLEQGFEALRQNGFAFKQGDFETYVEVVNEAGWQFAEAVEHRARVCKSDCIAVYGRGHWSMNAAAIAAERLEIPLFVIERGVLPRTHIVDSCVPFTSGDSIFRQSWASFSRVEVALSKHVDINAKSRWGLYMPTHPPPPYKQLLCGVVLAGQCPFDYNCINAPFHSPREFVEYAVSQMPSEWRTQELIYRPHPLSPENFPSGYVDSACGVVRVDTLNPSSIFDAHVPIVSWNSTLGLEAVLFHNGRAHALDKKCYYASVLNSDSYVRDRFFTFLQHVSVYPAEDIVS